MIGLLLLDAVRAKRTNLFLALMCRAGHVLRSSVPGGTQNGNHLRGNGGCGKMDESHQN